MTIMKAMKQRSARYTSLPVRPETLRRLKMYKTGGASYDDLINDLLDAHPPEEFFREQIRRLKEPGRPWSEIRKELDL